MITSAPSPLFGRGRGKGSPACRGGWEEIAVECRSVGYLVNHKAYACNNDGDEIDPLHFGTRDKQDRGLRKREWPFLDY